VTVLAVPLGDLPAARGRFPLARQRQRHGLGVFGLPFDPPRPSNTGRGGRSNPGRCAIGAGQITRPAVVPLAGEWMRQEVRMPCRAGRKDWAPSGSWHLATGDILLSGPLVPELRAKAAAHCGRQLWLNEQGIEDDGPTLGVYRRGLIERVERSAEMPAAGVCRQCAKAPS